MHPHSRPGRQSNSGVPLVAAVLPVAALPARDLVETRDQLDTHDVFRVLVAQLALDAQADRRAGLSISIPPVRLGSEDLDGFEVDEASGSRKCR